MQASSQPAAKLRKMGTEKLTIMNDDKQNFTPFTNSTMMNFQQKFSAARGPKVRVLCRMQGKLYYPTSAHSTSFLPSFLIHSFST
jgi:hypothetical protein